jgi:hypothetical protein
MKTTVLAFVVLALVGCSKDEAPSAPAAGGSAAPAGAKAEAKTAEAPKAEAPKAEAKPAPAAQKGLEAGQVIAGYLKDQKDEAQCAALPVPEAEKAKYDAAKIGEVAKMMKADVVASCPSDNVVGTCKMMGMLVNYSGPKYTKETAQKHCGENRGKWIE